MRYENNDSCSNNFYYMNETDTKETESPFKNFFAWTAAMFWGNNDLWC